MKVCWTLNKQKTIKKWLIFWHNFFNLLTCWLNGKFKSLPSLLRVYRIYPDPIKKKSLLKNQLVKNKWT